jgi:hypothetical protein
MRLSDTKTEGILLVEHNFPSCGKTGAPGAIPTRDLSLRSRIDEPFVSTVTKSLAKTHEHALHIVLEVPKL